MNVLEILASLKAGESITFCGPGQDGSCEVQQRDAALPDLVERVQVSRSILIDRFSEAAIVAKEMVEDQRERMRFIRMKIRQSNEREVVVLCVDVNKVREENPKCPKD